MTKKPIEYDSDVAANEKAKLSAIHAFQGRTSITTQPTGLRRIDQAPPSTDRQLITVEISIHNEYRMPSDNKIINAALSTDSETARLLIEHHAKGNETTVISFHSARINPEIPNGATFVRTAVDPTRITSFIQIYARAEASNHDEANHDAASTDLAVASADGGGSGEHTEPANRVGAIPARRTSIQ